MAMKSGQDGPCIVVVGSLNMDLVVTAPRRPKKGETLTGTDFATYIGGKGNNQAIAAARCGGKVTMVGRIGTDNFGESLLQKLSHEEVDAQFVQRDATSRTGIAAIIVDAEGDNSIVIVPGANGTLSPTDVDRATDAIASAKALLLQLEIPLETAMRAAILARKSGCAVILNPAPAQPLPPAFLEQVDILIPNEGEVALLTGASEAKAAARALRATYPRMTVIVTLGEHGALVVGAEGEQHIPGHLMEVVDTTAAGDAFCGAMAVALGGGKSLIEAVRFANAAGALAVTVAGAEASLPQRSSVERLCATASSHQNIGPSVRS